MNPESNLYFLRARYYDPTTGRFISKDPVKGILTNLQSLNPYQYAYNNPVNLSDPSGKFVPVLLAIWAVAEVGLSIYDAYDTGKTLLDPCASGTQKALSGGLFAAGLVLPGGGYGQIDDAARLLGKGDDVVDVFKGSEAILRNGYYEVKFDIFP